MALSDILGITLKIEAYYSNLITLGGEFSQYIKALKAPIYWRFIEWGIKFRKVPSRYVSMSERAGRKRINMLCDAAVPIIALVDLF